MDRTPTALARGYYVAIDDGDYDRLAELLAPDFQQDRGETRIDGRDAFVQFMREGRPNTDTTHEVDAVFAARETDDVAVQGRLRHADGSVPFGYVDVFAVENGRLGRLTTFVNRGIE